MFKVLIVDDDITVRMDLRALIPWYKMNMDLLQDAVNGQEAIDRVRQYDPDIIILDLSMPVMNGIEVIKTLKNINFHGKVVVLSCHEDFEYVKDALQYGANEYILKHRLDELGLKNVLNKMVQQLECDLKDKNDLYRLKQLANVCLPVMKRKFVNNLVNGHLTDEKQVGKQLGELGLEFALKRTVLTWIKIDDLVSVKNKIFGGDMESLDFAVENILDEIIAEYGEGISASCGNGDFCIVLGFSAESSYFAINNLLYGILTKVQSCISKFLKFTVTIGVSNICERINQVSVFCSQAKAAADSRFYIGRNKIIHHQETGNFNNDIIVDFAKYEKDIREALFDSKVNTVEQIYVIYMECKKHGTRFDVIRSLNMEMVSFVKKIQREYKINDEEIFDIKNMPYEYVNSLETIEEVIEWLGLIYSRLKSTILSKINSFHCRNEIKKAIDYIHSNYMKDITLENASTYTNLSKSYFSQVFKKETNENFVVYLTKLRIEKAKSLLAETDFKIYDISARVGIDNYRYFTKIFKEITGLTPVEYRNIHDKTGA